jgi:phosphate uptake regulator
MRRKIVKHGSSTLTVSIPTKWAKKQGLVQGSELNIEESDSSLIISKGEVKPQEKEVEIELEHGGRYTKRAMVNFYRLGYDSIKIHYSNREVIDTINRTLQDYMGFDIVEQTKGTCHIKEVAKVSKDDFDQMFMRFLRITSVMFSEGMEAVLQKRYDDLNEYIALESVQNRFYLVCLRIIAKFGREVTTSPESMTLLIRNLEDVADIVKYTYREIIKNKGCSKETESFMKEVFSLFNLVPSLYSKFDEAKGNRIMDEKKRLILKSETLLRKVSRNELMLMHYLIDILITIFYIESPLFGIYITGKSIKKD